MPYPNQHSARVIDPGKFDSKSFRTKNITKGVDIIIGKLKGETSMTTQTYRFHTDQFTSAEAKAWLKKNKVEYLSFDPATKTKESMKSKPFDIASDLLNDILKNQNPASIEDLKNMIEAERTFNNLRELLRSELADKFKSEYGPYIIDFTNSYVIYQLDKDPNFYQVNYTVDDKNIVIFGDPVEVLQSTVYEPVTESGQLGLPLNQPAEKLQESDRLTGQIIPLIEKKANKDGVIPIKIIEPGWGASGYYPEKVLKRDAGVYKEGTKMYWDHPKASDEKERPERSLNDLAGVLVSNGIYMEAGPMGPGIYSSAKVFNGFADKIDELAPYIGISHIAWGKANNGEAEGKKGKIVESLKIAESVDFVTTEGAGGKIVEMFESARNFNNSKQITMSEINKEEFDQLKTSHQSLESENKRLKEVLILKDAHDLAEFELKSAKLPDITKERLLESISSKPVLDDKGNLDKVKYTEAIKKVIADEIVYLGKLTETGKIRGMGESQPIEGSETDKAKMKEALKTNFIRLGLSEKAAEIAANGRN